MYFIAQKRSFYEGYWDAQNINGRWLPVVDAETDHVATYATYSDAKAALADLESGTYYTANGEVGRPEYRIHKTDSARGMQILDRAW